MHIRCIAVQQAHGYGATLCYAEEGGFASEPALHGSWCGASSVPTDPRFVFFAPSDFEKIHR